MTSAGSPSRGARRVRLLVDGVHDPEPTAARCVVWEADRIVWVGDDPGDGPGAERTLYMPGAWVTPAFVDAHVHATATGLRGDGVDLAGVADRHDLLGRVRDHADARDDDPLLGSRWQEHGWPEPRPPTSAEIAAAVGGRTVLLDRVDGHSCLVDPATLALVAARVDDGVDRDRDGVATGWLREGAAQAAREIVWSRLPPARLAAARQATVRHAASLGIASIHEMGASGLSSLDDALAWHRGSWGIDVQVWWADMDADAALSRGLHPGGDLFLDGAIGSRTAAVSTGYRDGPTLGGLFHPVDDVVAFFARCTRAGVIGGVHAIGDEAIEQAIAALERVARREGLDAVRACRHRIEHLELPRPGHAQRLAHLGVTASMQPAFDAEWGGRDGMYASRFGVDAALASNPFDAFDAAGVAMAFGSDSTVTPMAPWEGVRAAWRHHGGHGVAVRRALWAATVGGRRAARQDDVGPVRAGRRADLAVWDGDPLSALDDPAATPACAMLITEGRTPGR